MSVKYGGGRVALAMPMRPSGRESGSATMNENDRTEDGAGEAKVPVMQRVLDNPFLLLFLGVTVPTVFYIIWGVMEIVTIPIAR